MNLILINPVLRAYDAAHNLAEIEQLITLVQKKIASDDVILLPEHFTPDDNIERYMEFVTRLARSANCTVVGGSHHRTANGRSINAGCVIDRSGTVLGMYSKLRPYFNERLQVEPGDALGEIAINGKNFL